mgnify:FL=1
MLSKIPDVNCEFQVVLERKEDGKDHMTIRLECCQGLEACRRPELERWVASRVKNEINVSPQVVMVDYCSLPRSERKSTRIFDYRPL